MLLPTFLSVGALALTANAFLVPLDIDDPAATEFANSAISLNNEHQVIKLDCSTCPFALKSERNGAHEWTNDVASDLDMKFDIKDNALRFNTVPLYPITTPRLPPPLNVPQIKKDGVESTMEGYHGDLKMSYTLEYEEKPFSDGNTLVTVVMTVMGLDGQMVHVDDVEVNIIKDAEGKLSLHSTKTVPASPDAPDAKCGNVLCRVFSKFITKIATAKASAKATGHKLKCFCMRCFHRLAGHKHGKHPHDHKGPGAGVPHRRPDGTITLPSHIHFRPTGRPRPHHHHHNWHNKGFFGRVGHILLVTVKIAFVPILIGIAFGVAASAIGMLVGQAVVFLWMRYRRNDGEAAYEALETGEKEVPPPYEDVRGEAMNEKEVETKA